MDKPIVYLAGPIRGMTPEQCSAWREKAFEELKDVSFPASPMRDKENLPPGKTILEAFPNLGGLYTMDGIVMRDLYDVSRADIILANFLGAKQVSIFTIGEIFYGLALRKPTILVIEPKDGTGQCPNPNHHPVLEKVCLCTVRSFCRTGI